MNEERRFFVSREAIERVMAKAPSDQWKLLIALGRYGGLRVPSEVVGLMISDVDLERGRITIRSPKTEKQGKAKRVIPLWPELRPLIEKVIRDAPPEQKRLVRFMLPGYNPHKRFAMMIEQAGLKRWPKVWQNLRSTRETELLEDFPLHVVCGWIGNSERIARQHYLQITDEHFARATKQSDPDVRVVNEDGCAAEGAAKSAALGSDELAQLAPNREKKPRSQAENAVRSVAGEVLIAQDRI